MPKKTRKLEAVKDEAPKAPKTKALKVNEKQKAMLLDADRSIALAQERFNLVYSGICAAAGVPDGSVLLSVEGNTLSIQLPEEG